LKNYRKFITATGSDTPIAYDGKEGGKISFIIENKFWGGIMDNGMKTNKDRVCPQCKGTGRCKYCSGSGKHAYPGYGKPSDQPCMWCFGTGVCQQCKGKGYY